MIRNTLVPKSLYKIFVKYSVVVVQLQEIDISMVMSGLFIVYIFFGFVHSRIIWRSYLLEMSYAVNYPLSFSFGFVFT